MPRRLPIVPDDQLTPVELRKRMRARRTDAPRPRTLSVLRMPKKEMAELRLLYPEDPATVRPSVRAECANGPRPCPFVGCEHHLYLDVNPRTGSIQFNWPHLEPDELAESCALDVADRGGATLEEVGRFLNVTRARIGQIETRALAKLNANKAVVAIAKAELES